MADRKGTRLSDDRHTGIRLLTIALLIVGAWFTIGYQLYRIQVVRADELKEQAERQRFRYQETAASRGTMYDRQGRTLAVSVESRTIYANPRQIEDPTATALMLSDVLRMDFDRLLEKLSDTDTSFVFVARQVDNNKAEEVAKEVRARELSGIHFLTEPKRIYPSGSWAAHTVGFVDIDSIGIEGLEAEYDEILTGTPGSVRSERAAGGQVIPHSDPEVEPAIPGADLTISIDREIQYLAYQECLNTLQLAQADRCTLVALDPDTFEIQAMVVVPSFDPAERSEQDVASGALVNTAVRSLYEPGSTQKAVTVAIALEEGVVDWDTEYLVYDQFELVEGACEDNPTVKAEDGTEVTVFGCYTDFTPHPPQLMNVLGCIRDSSNVCMVMISQDLGRDPLHRYLHAFGYAKQTGIDFPGEVKSTVNLPRSCSSCPASAAIGYSLSVSPLQMASVYGIIANGGVRMEPRLVSSIIDESGVISSTAGEQKRVISEETARLVRLMLKSVVDSGTGTAAAVAGYTVGGKTGTTRKFDAVQGVYTDDYTASFVGMAPIDNPELVIAVVVDSPKTGGTVSARTGGAVAAPLFAKVMKGSLHQMGVRPDA